jgi:metallo-beta-lactamase class B
MKFIFLCLFALVSIYTSGQNKPLKIKITQLTDNIYVCTSYGILDDGSVYPANGLYIVTATGVIMIDTPWGEPQTLQLLDTLRSRYHKPVLYCISTHFHADRTGGVDILKQRGIKTYSTLLTKQLAAKNGDKQPEFPFRNDTTFKTGGAVVDVYYPGAGHTQDNIVIWLPQHGVLFGGCFIKSFDSGDIGNIADANLKAWPGSIENVRTRFKGIKYVIPGHEGWQGDTSQFGHTLKLIKQAGY